MSKELTYLYEKLKEYSEKPTTRSAIAEVELIKSAYIEHYKNLPNKTFSIHFEKYMKFIDLYRRIKNFKPEKVTVKINLKKVVRHTILPIHSGLELNIIGQPIYVPKEIISLIYRVRPLAITWKMSEFDFNIGLKLDELHSSKASDIKSFLALIKCYHATLSTAGKAALVSFVVAAKIKGEAKTRLGTSAYTTLEQLETAIYRNVLAKETHEELTRRLNKAQQGKRSIQDYGRYLEDLSTRLAACMVRDAPTLDRNTVEITCKKMAVTQFQNGCDENIKLVLAAARPATLDDAVAIASAAPQPTINSTYYVRKDTRQRRPGNNSNWNRENNNFRNNNNRGNGNWNRSSNNNANNWNRNNNNNRDTRNNNSNGYRNDNNNNNNSNFRGQNNFNRSGNNQGNFHGNRNNQRNWNRNVNSAQTDGQQPQQQQHGNIHNVNHSEN